MGWARHLNKGNRWTIGSAEWPMTKGAARRGVRLAGRLNGCWRGEIVGLQRAAWSRTAKDSKSWGNLSM